MRRKQPSGLATKQLAAEWAALSSKWESVPKFARTAKPKEGRPHYAPISGLEAERLTKNHEVRSLGSWVTGTNSTKPAQEYTGTAIVGVCTLHKSNAVPVFSAEDAISISQMRR